MKPSYLEIIKSHYDFDKIKSMSAEDFRMLFFVFWTWDIRDASTFKAYSDENYPKKNILKSKRNLLENYSENWFQKTFPNIKEYMLQCWINIDKDLFDTSLLTNDVIKSMTEQLSNEEYFNSIRNGELRAQMYHLSKKYFIVEKIFQVRRMVDKDFDVDIFHKQHWLKLVLFTELFGLFLNFIRAPFLCLSTCFRDGKKNFCVCQITIT